MTGRTASVLVSAALLLPACGGGDGGGEATTSVPQESAVLDVATASEPTEELEAPLARVQVEQGETLAEGATGDMVVVLQNALAELGFDPGPADGSFGPGTKAAVIAFQTRHSLPDDGIVGQETARIINQELGGAG